MTNPASDNEEIELYPEPCSSTTTEKDRINNWIEFSITGAIESGNKLRQSKPAPYQRKDGRPKLAKQSNLHKRYKRESNKILTSPCGCSYWSTPPRLPTSKNVQCNRVKSRVKLAKQPKCTVRVAQLAVPSKRHCLETWRDKSNLLSSYMIVRLKEHILDQRPVVQIAEAFDGFERRRYWKHKNKKSTKNCIENLHKHMPHRLVDTIKLCLIFSQIIAMKISQPLNLQLSPKLENLARVVSDEVARITKNKKDSMNKYAQQYRTIHTDATKKITIWIADILDDLHYKLTEEDLKDLEEEEGPILDFLDSVVDKVLDICLPKPEEHIKAESDDIDSSNVDPNNDEIWQHALSDSTNAEYFKNEIIKLISDICNETENTTDDVHFRNKIYSLIDNIFKESNSQILTDKEYFKHEIFKSIDYLFKDSRDQFGEDGDNYFHSGDNLTDIQHFENEIYRIISIICKNQNSNVDIDNANHGEHGMNGMDRSESSEDTDEDSKNVMFSNSDMVGGQENTVKVKRTKAKHAKEHKKRNIFFAEPNPDILSDADEIWPQDPLTPTMLRPSASVTKSVLSLGNLWETDEKHITTPQTNDDTVGRNEHEDSQHKKALKSIMSLVRILQNDQKDLTVPEADKYTIDDQNLLNSKSQMEVTMTVASIINILQNDEFLTAEDINDIVAEKLTLLNVKLPNDEATSSLVTLLNILRGDEKLLSATDKNAYIAVKIASLNAEGNKYSKSEKLSSEGLHKDDKLLSHTETPDAIKSILNVLQNDEHLTSEEINSVITENLKQINTNVPDGKVADCIEHFLNLQTTDKQLSPAEANIHIAEILGLLNEDLHDDKVTNSIGVIVKDVLKDEQSLPLNPETTKTMKSLLNILHDDDEYRTLRHEDKREDQESQHVPESHKLQNMISTYLTEKYNAESQTERVTLKPTDTIINSIEPNRADELIDNTINDQKYLKTAEARRKVKHKNKGIATDPIEDITLPYNDWKVHLETAPSWITQTNAHGEPSEDSVTPQANTINLTKCDINKWCKNMNKGFKNLEIWSDWLQNTCKQTASLLSKSNVCVCFNNKHEKQWVKLLHNVTKDAVLWRKMNKRTQEMFKNFQHYYGQTQYVPSSRQRKCVCKYKNKS